MGRVSRQRLGTGLSILLDLLALALFFIQSAVGDVNWIQDEFLDYRLWSSVSDLGILDIVKAVALLVVYSAVGINHLAPCVVGAAILSTASLAKIIMFIVHAATTQTKLPGLHFAMPVFIFVLGWIQVAICRFCRNLDLHYLVEQADQDTSSLGDYSTLHSSVPTYQTAAAKAVPRRRYQETEPLLINDSLSSSVPIHVVPSVPQFASVLSKMTPLPTLDSESSAPNTSDSLPPINEIASQMFYSLPRKTYIRSLKQISEAFVSQDVLNWLKLVFPKASIDRAECFNIIEQLLKSGFIESATNPDKKVTASEIEGALFKFS